MRVALLGIALTLASSAYADTYVEGYTKKDGTYVQPHYRSDSDGDRGNNYSTQGNVNPYTGTHGTKPLYDNNSSSGSYYGSGKKR